MNKDLYEAVKIIKGETMMIPEMRHLLAINNYYQAEFIKASLEADQLQHRVLLVNS